jgi:translation initiation factor IF-3
MQHQEEGRRVLDQVLEKLADLSKVERAPAMDGRRMTVLLAPKAPPAKGQPKPPAEKVPS